MLEGLFGRRDIRMAGFRVGELRGLTMVPHPAATLFLSFGVGTPVLRSENQSLSGSIVTGFGHGIGGGSRAQGTGLDCIQMRLSPRLLPFLVDVSADDLATGAVSVADLAVRRFELLTERIHHAKSWDERFSVLDSWLDHHLGDVHPPDPVVRWAWERIRASHGRVGVDDLAAEVGWSRKRLWARFRADFGLSPKRAARIVRFDDAVHRLVGGTGSAQVAAEAGFADQPHLVREIRSVSGVTPVGVQSEPFLTVDDTAWPRSG
ncbi:helix-turn-helix transcriptional regulator [Brevibacterium sp. UCMA 11754]|nr:helix-turn-helix transcriptional regulator [Brevibacterium sp. UCMA 11754]